MARADKAAAVAELTEEFRSSSAAVLTEYRGLTVAQLKQLRRSLGANASYAVVKNTLSKIAAREAGVAGLDDLLEGPSAIAFVKGDPVEVAKSIRDFGKANPALVVKGGVLEGKALTADDIRKLADLESREVLLAKLAGAMKASLSQAVYLLNAPLAQAARLLGALQSKAQEDPSVLAGGAGTPAPAAEASESETSEPVAEATEAPAEDTAAPETAETEAAPAAEATAAEESAEPTAEATEEAAPAASEPEASAETPAADDSTAEQDSSTEA